MAKAVLALAGGALALWAGAGFVLWRWQEKLIFFPKPPPPGVARELADMAVEIAAPDGAVLRGWEHPGNAFAPPTDCRLMIYFGGNNEEVSDHITDNGGRFSCPQWYINYRGFGESGGAPAADALRADALLVFDEAAKKLELRENEVCVLGRSLGSHMAAHVAANRPVKKLIMVTPFDSVLNIAKTRYPIFPVQRILRHPFDTLAEAPHISAPSLFLLAETDYVVPHAHSENLIANWPAAHTVVHLPETTHADIADAPSYWRAITHFMSPDIPPEDGE
ncbi:MAG: alpha/beta hydrolase [Gammaproteobacteria bacterium]